MEAKTTRKDFYKGTAWSVIENFSRQGVTFVVFIVLARMLDPKIFGLLSVSMLVIQVFRNSTFESIATAIIQKNRPDDLDFDTAFWYCAGLSLPLFLLVYFGAPWFEAFTHSPGVGEVLKAISFIILTSGISQIHQAWQMHRLNFRALAIRSFVSVVLGGGAGLTVAYLGYGIESLVTQQLVTSISEFILLWIITPWRPRFRASKESFREITSYGKHVSLTGITNFANQNSDILFVTYFLGSTATGIYSAGKRVTNTANTVISSALLKVSLPAFARLKHDDSQLRKTFVEAVTLTAMITAPLFAGIAVLSRDITLLLLGEKWLAAVPVMQIVSVVGFLTSIGYYNQSMMLAKNKPQWQTRLTLLYAIINVVLFFLFTRYGLIFTALAFALRSFLLFPVSVQLALKLVRLRWKSYTYALLPSVAASVFMTAVIAMVGMYLETEPVFLRLTILSLIGFFSYIGFIYWFMPMAWRSKAEKWVANSIIRKRSVRC